MIQIKYKPLFDLEILHNFYSSGKCPDLEMVPTANCQTQLTYLGLRFLPAEFGGKLFAKVVTSTGKDIIKNPIPENTKFSFLLKLKKNTFENFTNLNINKAKTSHYYFNNLSNNISTGGSPLLVADTISKAVSDLDLLPFVRNAFSHTEAGTADKRDSELQFIDTGESFQQSLNNAGGVFNFSYDLRKTRDGRAKFLINGTQKALMYVVEPTEFYNVFGVVEIFYKSSLPSSYQFQQSDNSIETKFYKIAFLNRSTRWRYVVTKKFNQSITGLSIAKTNGGSIGFTSQVTSPPTDQFIFASNNALPLKEENVTGIKLSDQANKIIIANLPNPALSLIKTEGTEIFSDILITI